MASINLLAVSVGNSRTRIGAFVDDKLTQVSTFRNDRMDRIQHAIDEAHAPLDGVEDTAVLLSTVHPEQGDRVEGILKKHLGKPTLRVERDMPIPIGRQLDREALVGEDRLLNAAAAYDRLKQACLIVDAGTAMTIDFVDGAGTFHGGAITPGAQLMLDALGQRAAMLPDTLELRKPAEVIGHSTAEAMLTGVFYGMRGIVREVLEQVSQEVGQYPMVIATGGDAQVLFREWDLVDRVVPDLTLSGIAVTLRAARSQAGKDE